MHTALFNFIYQISNAMKKRVNQNSYTLLEIAYQLFVCHDEQISFLEIIVL